MLMSPAAKKQENEKQPVVGSHECLFVARFDERIDTMSQLYQAFGAVVRLEGHVR